MGHYSEYMCVMVLLLFSAIESEHNFMDGDSQDDLLVQVSLVRNVCTYICMYIATYTRNGVINLNVVG